MKRILANIRRVFRWLAVTVLALALAACQGGADTAAPTIASSIPANGATNITVSANLSISFSEPMNQGSVTVNVSPALALGTPIWNTPSTVAFDLPPLAAGTSYTVSVDGQDLAGNALSGSKTLTFQTVAPPDTTPPATPANVKATAGDGEIFVDWSPNAEPDLVGYTVYLGTAPGALQPAVFVEKPGRLAKVTGLDNGTPYHYAVEAQDTSGNRSARSATATVTPKDMVAPALVSSEPADGSQELGLVPALRFTFSEPMDTGSLELGICLTDAPPASATCSSPSRAAFGAPSWGENDTAVRFTPTGQLQGGKTYVLVVFARDKGGNQVGGDNTVAFSLRAVPDTTRPTVLNRATTSSNPLTGVGYIELPFSEPMNQQSVQTAFLSQPPIACVWTWAGNTARCTGSLRQLTPYNITLGVGAADTSGNTLAAPYTFLFETPNFNPRLLSFSPSSRFGSPIEISPTAPIVLSFSEPMDQPLTQGALEVRVGTTPRPGTFTWNAEGTQMTYTPSSPYGNGVTVTWKLGTSAIELDGGPGRTLRLRIPAEVSGSFSTQRVAGP